MDGRGDLPTQPRAIGTSLMSSAHAALARSTMNRLGQLFTR
jgi:hypothetical protein